MRKIFWFFIVALVAFVIYYGFITYPQLDLISGFSAKSMASGHFIDHRSQEQIEQQDNDINLVDKASNSIDEAKQSAFSSVLGLKKRQAFFRHGLGATLINDEFDTTKPYLVPKRFKTKPNVFPYGDLDQKDTVFSNVDYLHLNQAVANAFDKVDKKEKRSRAVLVIYKDKIIAEKYDRGFSKTSKILGWSMTKSLTSAMFGVLEQQGKFDINKPAPILEWKNDDRKLITTHNLLQMNSGLEWLEDYDAISDVTKMLFLATDMGKEQQDKPALFKPNTHWNYSSGTTNLLSKILRGQFQTHQEYLDFWYKDLIDKIGMHSMLVETDMVGNYVGSSYAWATARDWAKFGLLYLHQGKWNGMQIFSENWVKYTATPTPTSNKNYGAQFWLNAGGYYPDAPRDMYYCSGYQGQMVAIIPSMDLVIVRMGLKGKNGFDFNTFLKEVTKAIHKK